MQGLAEPSPASSVFIDLITTKTLSNPDDLSEWRVRTHVPASLCSAFDGSFVDMAWSGATTGPLQAPGFVVSS
jgi:hypothetical protein